MSSSMEVISSHTQAPDHSLNRMALMEVMGKEMVFMQDLAHAGKIAQGIFIARKRA